MDLGLLDILTCPSCQSELHYKGKQELLVCKTDRLAFPIRNDKPIMLINEARELSSSEMKDILAS